MLKIGYKCCFFGPAYNPHYGNLVLSKEQIISYENFQLTPDELENGREKRCAQICEFENFFVCNLHLSNKDTPEGSYYRT